MLYFKKINSIIVFCLLISCCFISCEKKQKVGTLKITETQFVLEKNNKKVALSLDVKGKIKNTGPYDIKRIVITGRCNSCKESMISGQWFVTQEEKRPIQKATINYLAAGAEEPFHFEGIAYFYKSNALQAPESYPEGLEVYVESFETVQN